MNLVRKMALLGGAAAIALLAGCKSEGPKAGAQPKVDKDTVQAQQRALESETPGSSGRGAPAPPAQPGR